MEEHKRYMMMALELAAKAKGRTWPNPMVGAVIVKGHQVVGRGYHQKAGLKHAEIEALEQAENMAAGATLYVNLEPCCHSGKRTPPCTQAIIGAGIKTVVYGMDDPNPNVNGKGAEELKKAGIETIGKVMEKEAQGLNEVYRKYMTTGYPFTVLKMALSLDGRIATNNGESRGLSSEESLKLVHKMRLGSEAIMVGSGTVTKDDPELTVRLVDNPDNKQPTRFVVDSTLRSPINSKVFDQSIAKTVMITTDQADPSKKAELEKKEIEIWTIRALPDGMVDLKELLRVMGLHEYCNLLVEGGSVLATSFLKAGLIDKLSLLYTPTIIGGDGIPPFGQLGLKNIAEAFKLRDLKARPVGDDILIEAYPERD
jgi:diaminohydroxyphosphoribosylaminopyrimidine deaminase/5-amino-6-(5-phosphoribosylamino)uracil reductase